MWDGTEMTRRLRADLLESDNSVQINEYLSYRYINEAASSYVLRTNALTSAQPITTVAGQAEYTLSADHLNIHTEKNGNRFIKYNNGSRNSFPEWIDYEDVVYRATSTSIAIPGNFTIIPHPTLGSIISGTTTSAGAASSGECTLTDSTASFTDNANVGDVVHNDTDGSYGIVIGVTSGTALLCALFGGTDNNWTSNDTYAVIPQGRLRLIMEPAPKTAGHTITVYYAARPAPVYSGRRTFRIQSQFIPGILRDAKALYELRSGDYEKGGADKQYAQIDTLAANVNYSKTFSKKGYKVNLKRRW